MGFSLVSLKKIVSYTNYRDSKLDTVQKKSDNKSIENVTKLEKKVVNFL